MKHEALAVATVGQVATVLGGPAVLGRPIRSVDDLVRLVREGLPYPALEAAVQRSCIGIERLTRAIGISRTTRARRRNEGRFSPEESDRLCRFARVFAHALDVFEEAETASRWFSSPIEALGKEHPIELVQTDVGAQQVDEVLGRIEHGIAS